MSFRSNKAGFGYEVQRKMEANYDREDAQGTPKHIINWINSVMSGEKDYVECKDTDWKSLCTFLRDGVILCKFINILLAKEEKPKVLFSKKCANSFAAMTNIENFNKGCETYGLAKEFSFQSGDLWELRKGPFYNVINCLHSLGFTANSKSYIPAYAGEITKYADRD
ncbi:transgelin-3-like isoform X3 [Mizuhopecten yessoensis]|uniref:transgelin-3-like isoform X3 n=1 Tax=Mizuhopecten yessoensis TaxID=6573 RepID=UPI000B45C4F0|nr:transgelin-3-like isoform X3 [Mizuhopecten yessoensis]